MPQELEAAHRDAAEHRTARAGCEAKLVDTAEALQAAQDELSEVRNHSSFLFASGGDCTEYENSCLDICQRRPVAGGWAILPLGRHGDRRSMSGRC